MERQDEHGAETRPPRGGVAGDFRRLKSDGAATVAELRDFLGQMKGKSSQEVLGMVAKSGLTRSILLATFLFAVLLVALTVGPYLLGQQGADAAAPAAGAGASAEQETAQPAESNPGDGRAEAAGPDESPASSGEGEAVPPDADQAIDAMGIGEARVADPDENPLEDKLDNLLDGIE
jgi:preprotein translocase subunit SecG